LFSSEFTPTGSSTPNSSRDAQSLDVEMSSLSQAHQSSVAEGAHTFAADDAAEMAKKVGFKIALITNLNLQLSSLGSFLKA
jgi:hypothetical protein